MGIIMKFFVSSLLACAALAVPKQKRGQNAPTFVLENDWPDSFYEGEKMRENTAEKMTSWFDALFKKEEETEWPEDFFKGELKGGKMAEKMRHKNHRKRVVEKDTIVFTDE